MTRTKKTKSYRYRRHRQVKRLIIQRRNAVLQELPSAEDYLLSPPEFQMSNNNTPLKEFIRSWVNCHGIATRAVNDLLRILNSAGKEKFSH